MISYLLAMGINGTIGKDNQLPWHLPADLQYFKKVTMGHTIIMGRKTYESIGKPLPGRENIVLTRDSEYIAEGCVVCQTPEKAIAETKNDEEAFVIGGSKVFEAFKPYVDRMYITLIDHEFEGDTTFLFNKDEWNLVSDKLGTVDEKNKYKHRFQIYERKIGI